MKIILSRKGFDSANGGIVSPIMEDGSLITLPIPSKDKDKFEDLSYGEHSYSDILRDLKYKADPEYPSCHVDPDLSIDRRKKKIDGWCPVFGQVNSSALYLRNTVGIQPGDLFLFFGNYHKVKFEDGRFQYVRRSGDFYSDNDLQVIWGYMQIGRIVTDPKEQKRYSWHPHSSESYVAKEGSNVMFVAREKLSFNDKMSGAGLLKFRKDRVLTAEGCNKATWVKRPYYDVDAIIGNRRNASANPCGIYYAGIWQELGLRETVECEEWAKSIVHEID